MPSFLGLGDPVLFGCIQSIHLENNSMFGQPVFLIFDPWKMVLLSCLIKLFVVNAHSQSYDNSCKDQLIMLICASQQSSSRISILKQSFLSIVCFMASKELKLTSSSCTLTFNLPSLISMITLCSFHK